MKTSKKNVGRRILSLIFWGGSTIFFSSGEAQAAPPAPRCTPLNFSIEFAQTEIDITGMSVPNDDLVRLSLTNYAGIECDGSSFDLANIAAGFVVVQTGQSPILIPREPNKSQVSIPDSKGFVGLLSFPTGKDIGYKPVIQHTMAIELIKKRPGATDISIFDLLGSGLKDNMYSAFNGYDNLNIKERGEGITFGDKTTLRLIYRPTCSASVNNVDFGNLNVSDIINGVTKQAYVDIDCNDLLLAYSIKVTSGNGSDDNGIFSENDTVGYRLTWGDLKNTGLESSLSGKAIELNNELDNKSDPKYTRFSIPINITPVSRLSFGNDIKPGKADSVINIELKFK